MAEKRQVGIRFDGKTLAQIEEIERLSGKPILAILRELVNQYNWLYKERSHGAQLQIVGPDPDASPLEVVLP
jgi:hypothetical protein